MNFTEMTRDELRQVARENGLKVGGRKAELLERVQTHFSQVEVVETEIETAPTEVKELELQQPEVAIADIEAEPVCNLVTVAPVWNPEPISHKIILLMFALVAIAIEGFIILCQLTVKAGRISRRIHNYCKPIARIHTEAIVELVTEDIYPWISSKVGEAIEHLVFTSVMAALN